MTHKIEILLNYSSEDYERIVLMDGIEKYRDKRLWTTSFPEDTDPIRYLEMFLLDEKPQYRAMDAAIPAILLARSTTSGSDDPESLSNS